MVGDDLVGFFNGCCLGDDVVDIVFCVVMGCLCYFILVVGEDIDFGFCILEDVSVGNVFFIDGVFVDVSMIDLLFFYLKILFVGFE